MTSLVHSRSRCIYPGHWTCSMVCALCASALCAIITLRIVASLEGLPQDNTTAPPRYARVPALESFAASRISQPASARDPCPDIPVTGAPRCSKFTGPGGHSVCCCSWTREDERLEEEDDSTQSLRSLHARSPLPDHANRWGCFPSLFIPGAQKAGTTALGSAIVHSRCHATSSQGAALSRPQKAW